jgi:Protein of unknown function (DUF5663)
LGRAKHHHSYPTMMPSLGAMPEHELIRIDAAMLADVGLSRLPASEANVLLKHVYDTLERRAGEALAQRMSVMQLNEFEKYFMAKDDKGAFRWLETNFPDYKQVVHDEFDLLSVELRQLAPTILGLTGSNA